MAEDTCVRCFAHNEKRLMPEDLLPDTLLPLESQREEILLAMLVWGEARGEPVEGKLAVANVVRNRVNSPRWWGQDWLSVMLKPLQFSCFNEGDTNLPKLYEPTKYGYPISWLESYTAAIGVYLDMLPDPTGGATHYVRVGTKPDWLSKMSLCVMIGNHEFYRER